MAAYPKHRSMNGTGDPQADRWTRESFTLRCMTWSNSWLLIGALLLLALGDAPWMAG